MSGEEIKLPPFTRVVKKDGRVLLGLDIKLVISDDILEYQDLIDSAWISFCKQVIPVLENDVKRLRPKVIKSQPWWDK
jgi:hypothetical protein